MKKTFLSGFLAAFLFCGTIFASDCAKVNPDLADGDILYAANYNGELNNLISCNNLNLNKLGGTLTGDLTENGGNIFIWAGKKLGIYSDAGSTLEFQVDGANGNTTINGTLALSSSILGKIDNINTDATADVELADFKWHSASPATNDIGRINFYGNSNTTTDAITAGIQFAIEDVTHATRTSALLFNTMKNGLSTDKLIIDSDGVTALNAGFRVYPTEKVTFNAGIDTSYITEFAAGKLRAVAGGAAIWENDSTQLSVGATKDLVISSGKNLYIDGGSDTYVTEASSNFIRFYTGGTASLGLGATGIGVTSGNKIFLDNTNLSGDTYIYESSPNVISVYSGGSSSANFVAGQFNVPGGNHIDLNGSAGADYLVRSGTGQIDLYSAGVLALRTNSNGEVLMADVDPPTANYSNRNGNAKGWGVISSSGTNTNTYNCSVSRSSAGVYVVTWATDFANANYAVMPAVTSTPSSGVNLTISADISTRAAGSITIRTYANGVASDVNFNFVAFGDQ